MAFEIRKISDVGVGHPVVARLGVQASDLIAWIDIEDAKRKEIAEMYARTLTERLLRCHQFRDDLVNRINSAVETDRPPQSDKRIREVPNVIGLKGIAEGEAVCQTHESREKQKDANERKHAPGSSKRRASLPTFGFGGIKLDRQLVSFT